MPKIFLIPIETSVRELDYKLLLSLKLAQKDAMVFLGSKGKLLPLIESMTNFNYLDKGYHKTYITILKIDKAIFSALMRKVRLTSMITALLKVDTLKPFLSKLKGYICGVKIKKKFTGTVTKIQ